MKSPATLVDDSERSGDKDQECHRDAGGVGHGALGALGALSLPGAGSGAVIRAVTSQPEASMTSAHPMKTCQETESTISTCTTPCTARSSGLGSGSPGNDARQEQLERENKRLEAQRRSLEQRLQESEQRRLELERENEALHSLATAQPEVQKEVPPRGARALGSATIRDRGDVARSARSSLTCPEAVLCTVRRSLKSARPPVNLPKPRDTAPSHSGIPPQGTRTPTESHAQLRNEVLGLCSDSARPSVRRPSSARGKAATAKQAKAAPGNPTSPPAPTADAEPDVAPMRSSSVERGAQRSSSASVRSSSAGNARTSEARRLQRGGPSQMSSGAAATVARRVAAVHQPPPQAGRLQSPRRPPSSPSPSRLAFPGYNYNVRVPPPVRRPSPPRQTSPKRPPYDSSVA